MHDLKVTRCLRAERCRYGDDGYGGYGGGGGYDAGGAYGVAAIGGAGMAMVPMVLPNGQARPAAPHAHPIDYPRATRLCVLRSLCSHSRTCRSIG